MLALARTTIRDFFILFFTTDPFLPNDSWIVKPQAMCKMTIVALSRQPLFLRRCRPSTLHYSILLLYRELRGVQRSRRHLKTDWGTKVCILYEPPCKWEKVANLKLPPFKHKRNKPWYEKLHDRQNGQKIWAQNNGHRKSQKRSFCISPPLGIQPATLHDLLPSSILLGSRHATSFCPTENLNLWIPEPRFQSWAGNLNHTMISNQIQSYLMMWSCPEETEVFLHNVFYQL